jgi:hypothetical protein
MKKERSWKWRTYEYVYRNEYGEQSFTFREKNLKFAKLRVWRRIAGAPLSLKPLKEKHAL